jgi:hypothetical protein
VFWRRGYGEFVIRSFADAGEFEEIRTSDPIVRAPNRSAMAAKPELVEGRVGGKAVALSRYHLVNKINRLREQPLPSATLNILADVANAAANPDIRPKRGLLPSSI